MKLIKQADLRGIEALALSGSIVAAALALSGQADAASIAYTTDTGTAQFGFFNGEAGSFSDTIGQGDSFSDTYKITFDGDVNFNVSFTLTPNPKTGAQLNFTSVTFDGNAFAATPGQTYTFTGLTGRAEGYDLVVQGENPTSGDTGSLSYSGAIAASAVPEPASWAMMIGGFGLVGGSLRRRETRTSVSFA